MLSTQGKQGEGCILPGKKQYFSFKFKNTVFYCHYGSCSHWGSGNGDVRILPVEKIYRIWAKSKVGPEET
jgi:hypothetical protein